MSVIRALSVAPGQLSGFRSVRGHDGVKLLLRRAVEHDRLAHVFLFAGPAGVGKDRMALALAQVVNCTARLSDGDACGACESCRRIREMIHPDVIVVQRFLKDDYYDEDDPALRLAHLLRRIEDNKEWTLRPNITVEQIQDHILKHIAYRPYDAIARFIVVREAELIQEKSSNMLLKTLEEPQRDTYFVLGTSKPSSMLPTVRSRSQIVRFGPLADADVSAILRDQGVAEERIGELTTLGEGSVGRALSFVDESAYTPIKDLRDAILVALRSGSLGGYVTIGEKAKAMMARGESKAADGKGADIDDFSLALTLLQRHFRAEVQVNADSKPRTAVVNALRADIVREVQQLIDSRFPVNAQLLMESMLVRLREVRG